MVGHIQQKSKEFDKLGFLLRILRGNEEENTLSLELFLCYHMAWTLLPVVMQLRGEGDN